MTSPHTSSGLDPRPLRYGATLPIDRIDPLTGSWNEPGSMVFSRPITVDAVGAFHGDLADEWEIAPDRMSCRLRARAGVTWHDGVPFGAHDLAFSLGLTSDPDLAGQVKPALPDVAAIDVAGDTVTVTFSRPVVGLASTLARTAIVPAHRFDKAAVLAGAISADPIGTGPYRVVERGPGIVRFAYHPTHPFAAASPAAPIATIEMRHVADDAERARAIAAGELDFGQVKAQHLGAFADATAAPHRIATRVWRALTFGLNVRHFSDPRVRRAFSMAIDREQVVAAALGGYGLPQYWPVPPTSWVSPDVEPLTGRGPAAELLLEVGWTRDANYRWVADGEPVRFTFCYLETETFRTQASFELARQFAEFGVEVALEPITWEQYAAMDRVGLRGSDYDGIVVGWSCGVDPYENLASRYSTTGAYNRDGYSCPELDDLLERAAAADDPAAARALYREALEITHRDSIMAPLVNAHYVFAAAPDLTGFEHLEVDSFYELTQYAYLFHREQADTPRSRNA